MWPSTWTPACTSFGSILCPNDGKCELPYCLFRHEVTSTPGMRPSPSGHASSGYAPLGYDGVAERELDVNQTKLNRSTKEPAAPAGPSETDHRSVFTGAIISKDRNPITKEEPSASSAPTALSQSNAATKATDPKPPPATRPETLVALLPRKLAKDPVPFTKRLSLLRTLHTYMKPLNDKIAKATRPDIRALHLTSNQLIRAAVDEEEQRALSNPPVYENLLKHRLVQLKSMTPEAWVKERREAAAKASGDAPKKPQLTRIDTGLTSKEELVFLSMLICPQEGLDKHGYVTELPSEKDLNEMRLALSLAGGWEGCCRCSTRFQVFPERREEDGALTTGGPCKHHFGKRNPPPKTKNLAPAPTTFSCCNEPVGSPGCAKHDTHVFKTSNPVRLSLVMPFIETPPNPLASKHTAVCFDCEMGYTTYGFELMRLTVVSWPSHKPLVDVLVRPLGHVLDVNTRFSGITAEQLLHAKPYDPENPKPNRNNLRIVESPYEARKLFLSHVSRETPVLGHALENDLNTIRLIHPTIVDTVLLYPTQKGLPFRHGLRNLAKWHLGEDIQQGGAAGHDSFEDARTTGELVRFKIKEKWKTMKHEGWQITEDSVLPPMPSGAPPSAASSAPTAPSMVPVATTATLEGKAAVKRKFDYTDIEMSDATPAVKKLK
jgi:RNA exonuclease 1